MLNPSFIQLLVASAIAGFIGIGGYLLGSSAVISQVGVTLESKDSTPVVGEEFVVTVALESLVPVNVFKGLLLFDSQKLEVVRIDYNTSIANLWAEEPWYSNGDGTISFIGGTTIQNGFSGTGTLLTITFAAKNPGEARLSISDMNVLQHDGLGTDATITKPIDAIFAVAPAEIKAQSLFEKDLSGPMITIIPERINTDLNGDGVQNMVDISIFMTHLVSQNTLSDFNNDKKVDLKDLSILNKH